jgi:hypothetical protein
MRNVDQGTSLFWFVFSLLMCAWSYRLGLGKLQVPGMGFMPFVASILLGIFSLILFINSSLRKNKQREKIFSGKWVNGVIIIIALSLYAWIVPLAGYRIATFLFMAITFKFAGTSRWWKAVGISIVTTFTTFYLFSVLLGIPLPTSRLGF